MPFEWPYVFRRGNATFKSLTPKEYGSGEVSDSIGIRYKK